MMELSVRNATENDLTALVQMLGYDKPGNTREDVSTPVNSGYFEAFKPRDADPNNELIAACYNEGCFEKLGFWIEIKTRMEILPEAYS